MTVRDFMTADKAVAVEQFNTGRKQGCIVRWDFETVKNQVPTADARKMRRGAARLRNGEEQTAQQFVVRDSGIVVCSVKVYHELPTADVVVADIEADLAARYEEGNRPDVDVEQYRLAIENLHNLNRVG